MSKPVVAITIGQFHYPRMFSAAAWKALETFAQTIHHPGQDPATKEELISLLLEADACITSWDVARLDEDVMAAAPRLRAVAHMGSSVKRFVSPALWERRVHVTSSGLALALDVAETTLGLMIVGMKRIWPIAQCVREGGWRESPYWPSRELHNKQVGIVGASNVGRHVIQLLEPFGVNILLYDPFITDEEAEALGVTKVELDTLLIRSDVVSLHAPAKDSTYHLLSKERLALMKDDALLINTARGSMIDEEALIEEVEKGRFFVFLDVTDPEPPPPDSPLRQLDPDRVVITPHMAGCIESCCRMGEMAVEELRRFFADEKPIYQITPAMLSRIA